MAKKRNQRQEVDMRRVLLALALAASLSGCAALSQIFPTGTTGANIVLDTQNAAVAICGFLPTAETVAGIIATGNPILQTASTVANAICAAVAPKTPVTQSVRHTVRVAPVPTVSGVPVYGQFIH
jgi:hypothetical protein